jgi:hypothetical protein
LQFSQLIEYDDAVKFIQEFYPASLFLIHLLSLLSIYNTVYQDMEKDNKSVPMRVFSNFPIDTLNTKATATSILQSGPQQGSHRHAIHSRLIDLQMCSNEIIDLSTAQTAVSATTGTAVNLNAQSRPYELTKINTTNMMSIYDVNSSAIASFNDIVSTKSTIVNNLDILNGISKGTKLF